MYGGCCCGGGRDETMEREFEGGERVDEDLVGRWEREATDQWHVLCYFLENQFREGIFYFYFMLTGKIRIYGWIELLNPI
jgi:hypothetical protein